jgi:hypothetical protein
MLRYFIPNSSHFLTKCLHKPSWPMLKGDKLTTHTWSVQRSLLLWCNINRRTVWCLSCVTFKKHLKCTHNGEVILPPTRFISQATLRVDTIFGVGSIQLIKKIRYSPRVIQVTESRIRWVGLCSTHGSYMKLNKIFENSEGNKYFRKLAVDGRITLNGS